MHTSITVPATAANLGAGFDIFALALDLQNEVHAEVRGGNAPLTIDPGAGAPAELADAELNLVARSYTSACAALGVPGTGVHLRCVNRIPFARGLGSSAAAALGGVLTAVAIHGDRWSHDDILGHVAGIEGHSDNAAAALLGGLAISTPGASTVTMPVPDDLRAVVFVPDAELRTEASRRVVPTTLPRADAVFNASRCALLVRALARHDYATLAVAMEDRWHQRQRAALFPAMPALIAAALSAGARGAALAGAGPSIIALCDHDPGRVAGALELAAGEAGVPGSVRVGAIPNQGASIVTST